MSYQLPTQCEDARGSAGLPVSRARWLLLAGSLIGGLILATVAYLMILKYQAAMTRLSRGRAPSRPATAQPAKDPRDFRHAGHSAISRHNP
jgi:hypothetical protein